jgi:hypothetical protein
MTPRPRLLLLLLLPLLQPLALLLAIAVPAACAASTLAVSASSASPTVCGVAELSGTVHCAALQGASSSNASSGPVAPSAIAFAELSAGRGFVCGLQAGGAALFCWPSTPAPRWGQLRRLYDGPAPLADLAAGADHVAAYDASGSGSGTVLWWRGGGRFPARADGAFRSLVSGDGFSCAVEASAPAAVRCWGPRGGAVQAGLANASAAPCLAAGGDRACAVLASGTALCSGAPAANASAAAPPGDLFGYGLAVGDSHACALRRPYHTAVCWSLGGPTTTLYEPALGISFEFLVAGGNFTCGVASSDFSVYCWSVGAVAAPVPLPRIRPGVCVADDTACRGCGFMPQSQQFCGGSGGICDALCDGSPPLPPAPPPPPPRTPPPSSSRRVSKAWIAFCVVGAAGGFAGLCSIVYCLVFGFCSNKRVHNSVQPNISAAADNNHNHNSGVVGGSPYGSPNGSRARGLFRRQLSRAMTRQRSGPSSFKDAAEEFTFAQLEAATKGFALEARIGEGSFGTVYRGKLSDGREVAIKRGECGPRAHRFQEKESAFRSELAFLSRLHHKHLVALVGYCEENEERLLVYEYMKNGALYDHLHPKASAAPSPVASSWKLRIKILLDASRGIEYLHSYAVPPIIHRDIKSSNILLDGGWMARVSDFGLSLMGPLEPAPSEDDAAAAAWRSRSRSRSQHLTVVKAAGTVGYMDPEYYGLHHLTVKSDVYGFGVVMLESLTGRRAIFKSGEGGSPVSVVDYAVPSIAGGELGKVLDPRAPEPAAHEAEAVELVAYTAVHCVRLEGKDRPAMADVVANLETAFALCEGSAGGGVGVGNSSSSASLSVTSMDRSGALA